MHELFGLFQGAGSTRVAPGFVHREVTVLIKKILFGISVSAFAAAISMTAAQAQSLPDYYPGSYKDIVEASKAEGKLLVQSNVGEPNWRPILEAFAKEYPWIKVQTLDLSGTEVFER